MKYIITESQYNFIKRRYSFIRQLMDRELVDQEPCYYKYYGTGFDSYKRAVLEGVTEFVMQEFPNFYGMDEEESDEKWDMIYDSLEELFSNEIEDYYDNADCSEYEEGYLNESEIGNRTKNVLSKLYQQGKTIIEINNITGLPFDIIVSGLKDYEMEIDCIMAYELIIQFFTGTNLLKKNIETKNYKIELDYNNWEGTIEYKYRDTEYIMGGYCTPYWDGNCDVPIENINIYELVSDEDFEDDNFVRIKLPERFESYSELIEWFNGTYIKILSNTLKEFRNDISL